MNLVTERKLYQYNVRLKRFGYQVVGPVTMIDTNNDIMMVKEGLRNPKLQPVDRKCFENKETLKGKPLTKREIHDAFALFITSKQTPRFNVTLHLT